MLKSSGKYLAWLPPKMHFLTLLLGILTVSSLTITQQDRYVSVQSCAYQSCITMDQYAVKAAEYFIAGSTFIFLPGNHSSHIVININDVTNITLRGHGSSSVYILCKNKVALFFKNATNIYIERLVFILYAKHLSIYISVEPSALQVFDDSSVSMHGVSFFGSGDPKSNHFARAVYSEHSTVVVTNCLFKENTGVDGGAIYATTGSNVTLNGSVFLNNRAEIGGGALYARDSMVTVNGIQAENCTRASGQLSRTLRSSGWLAGLESLTSFGIALFIDNVALDGGAICVADGSTVTFSGTCITFQNNSASDGGSMLSDESVVITNAHHLHFINNRAKSNGGAIHIAGETSSTLLLGMNGEGSINFSGNLAENGGGIYVEHLRSTRTPTRVTIMGNTTFTSNVASASGGAVYVQNGNLTLSSTSTLFYSNRAEGEGGAVCSVFSSVIFNGSTIEFENNTALNGGGVFTIYSKLMTAMGTLSFSENYAAKRGGGIHAKMGPYGTQNLHKISGNFTGNRADECGGAMYIDSGKNIHFMKIFIARNSGSALCVLESTIRFNKSTNINENTGEHGGGIRILLRNSHLSFSSETVFANNSAIIGGAIYSGYGTTLEFSGKILFTGNRAATNGGALYALGTEVVVINDDYRKLTSFENNLAVNGGALFLSGAAITLDAGARLNFLLNSASQYGGGIYSADNALTTQCNFKYSDIVTITDLPYCFIGFKKEINMILIDASVFSNSNTAGTDGSFLYGGLLDRCQLLIDKFDKKSSIIAYPLVKKFFTFHRKSDNPQSGVREIASQPYQLCFCEDERSYNCSSIKNVEIHRGQKFNLRLLAIDQFKYSTPTQITAKVRGSATLKLNQSYQMLPRHCSILSYNLYSTKDSEELELYIDGPCRDTGVAKAVINVTLLPCPNGFNKSNERCICEERLREHGLLNCTSDEGISIMREAASKVWVSALYENGTYHGLILCKNFPVEYSKSEAVNISLDNPDFQCDLNRSGLLCGACAVNYSLMLGGSRCAECSNTYLALILPFAAAGIVLVTFLSVLRLTVATGTINSVIFYANIVQVNKSLLLPTGDRNVLTIFIAWMNFDLGFETCFYRGMTAYVQTWLQFAFPVYVWLLISMIILTSRYSITVSKLIGHNPIAVLATLLLMSYTKILMVIIDVYSSAELDYPHNKTVTVWLRDGNVPYLQSWHLALTVVTSLVFVFFFLPYTFLLLLGYKLYRFKWLNRLKPLLDSYYAPYKTHTRFWTGFLLLVRCALYIVFSYNSLGATSKSFLAINATIAALVITAWLSIVIYKSFVVNAIEGSVYLNLIILSAAASNGIGSSVVVYSLIGVVFVTMVSIVMYHFHITYTAKSALWLTASTRCLHLKRKLCGPAAELPPVEIPVEGSSQDRHKIITRTVVDLREPLLSNQAVL